MASEQTNANEAIAKATRVAIQAMVAAATERPQSMGPKKGGPAINQPNFNREAENKYNEL